jgi:hypothetical protein
MLYASEGESQTAQENPRKIDCDEKHLVKPNRVGQIIVMMRNGQRGSFYL